MAALVFVIIPILSKILARLFKWDATFELMLNYSNLGFMGFPLVESLYGKESFFYTAIFMMVFNVHIFTVEVMTLQGKSGERKQSLHKLFSPGILSAVIAFLLVLFPIPLPATLKSVVSGVGNCTMPLAIIVIGSQLAEGGSLESLKQHQLYILCIRF